MPIPLDVFLYLIVALLLTGVFLVVQALLFRRERAGPGAPVLSPLLLTGLVALVVALAAAGLFLMNWATLRSLGNLRERNAAFAEILSNTLDANTLHVEGVARHIAADIDPAGIGENGRALNAAEIAVMKAVLDEAIVSLGYSAAFVLDADGLVVASTDRDETEPRLGLSYASDPIFTRAIFYGEAGYFASGASRERIGYYASRAVRSPSGVLKCVVVVQSDIDFLYELFRLSPYPSFIEDPDGVVFYATELRYAGQPFASLLVNSVREAMGKPRIFLPEALPFFGDSLEDIVLLDGQTMILASQLLSSTGWRCHSLVFAKEIMMVRAAILILFGFVIVGLYAWVLFFGSFRLRRFLGEIRRAEDRFSKVFESAPIPVFITDLREGQVLAANDRFKDFLGLESDLSAIFLSEIVSGPDWKAHAEASGTALVETFSRFTIRKTESEPVLLISASILFHEATCRLFFAQGLAETRKSQRALEESRIRYREMADLLTEIVVEADLDRKIQFVNEAGFRAYGYTRDEVYDGMRLTDFIADQDAAKASENIRILFGGGRIDNHEYLMRKKDGSCFPAYVQSSPIHDAAGSVVGFRSLVIDLTNQKKFDEEMRRADKLEALGTLAGGIAHDFNNILSIFQNAVSLVRMDIDDAKARVDETLFEKIHNAMEQAKKLTGQLLSFSRGYAPVKKSVSLKTLVKDVAEFALTGSAVRAEFDLPEEAWSVQADIGQIGQVFQNLLINAVQALPRGGTVKIGMRNLEAPDEPDLRKCRGLCIRTDVEDNGPGIDGALLTRIFDPFFTTKEKGSGLGLSVAQRIVKNHGGDLLVKSEPGKGARFTVFLPAEKTPAAVEATFRATPPRGSGRILFMDDEEILRILACRLLEKLGYEARAVENGREAVSAYAAAVADGKPFDAVILDLVVPGDMGGREALELLKRDYPGIKAIVSSGYSNAPIVGDYLAFGFNGVVTKPYSAATLGSVLRDVLSSEKPFPLARE